MAARAAKLLIEATEDPRGIDAATKQGHRRGPAWAAGSGLGSAPSCGAKLWRFLSQVHVRTRWYYTVQQLLVRELPTRCIEVSVLRSPRLGAMSRPEPFRQYFVRLAPQWYADAGPISIYYTSRTLMPAKTRVFLDFVVDAFRRQRLAERFVLAARPPRRAGCRQTDKKKPRWAQG